MAMKDLKAVPEELTFIVSDPKGCARRSSLKRTGTSQLNHCLL